MSVSGVLTGAATVLVAEVVRQVLTVSAARSRARRTAGLTIYPLTLAGRLVFDAAILIMGGLAAIVLYAGDDWRIAALLGGFTLLCVFAYPGDVVVDAAFGVRTRRWYGRAVAMAWHDVAELRRADGIGQTTLIATGGRKIVHTSFHADGPGFSAEVQRYAAHASHRSERRCGGVRGAKRLGS